MAKISDKIKDEYKKTQESQFIDPPADYFEREMIAAVKRLETYVEFSAQFEVLITKYCKDNELVCYKKDQNTIVVVLIQL